MPALLNQAARDWQTLLYGVRRLVAALGYETKDTAATSRRTPKAAALPFSCGLIQIGLQWRVSQVAAYGAR